MIGAVDGVSSRIGSGLAGSRRAHSRCGLPGGGPPSQPRIIERGCSRGWCRLGRGIWISEGRCGTTAAHTGARRLAEAAERALRALSAPPLAGSKLPDRPFRQEKAHILLGPPPGPTLQTGKGPYPARTPSKTDPSDRKRPESRSEIINRGLCLAGNMLTVNNKVKLGYVFSIPQSSLLIEYQRLSRHCFSAPPY